LVASIVTALMTPLMPGAGPPPTTKPRRRIGMLLAMKTFLVKKTGGPFTEKAKSERFSARPLPNRIGKCGKNGNAWGDFSARIGFPRRKIFTWHPGVTEQIPFPRTNRHGRLLHFVCAAFAIENVPRLAGALSLATLWFLAAADVSTCLITADNLNFFGFHNRCFLLFRHVQDSLNGS
jgi:hypothetical protein